MSPDNSALPTPPNNDNPEQPPLPQNPFQPFPSEQPVAPAPNPTPNPVVAPTPAQTPAFSPATSPEPTPAPIFSSASEPTPTPMPMGPQPKPKRRFGKKSLLLTIIAVLVLLSGGTAAAYEFYYQNPNKVVSDALFNVGEVKTLDTTTNFSYSDKSYSLGLDADIAYDQQAISANGTVAVTVKDTTASSTTPSKLSIGFGGYINKDGSALLKISNIEDIAKLYMATDSNTAQSIFGKFDNKWISFDSQSSSSSDATQQCFANAYDKLSTDKSQQNEIIKAYQDNLFLVIDKKLPSKTINGVGSLGYQLHLDYNKFYAFGTALKQTTLGKAISNCDSTVFDAFNKPDSSNTNTQEYDVYISRFGHQLTQISANYSKDDQKLSLTISLKNNTSVKIDKPKADMTFQNLLNDIESSYMDYYLGTSGSTPISFGV